MPTGKLHKKIEAKKLKNTPAGYEGRFYRTLGDPFDKLFDTDFQQSIIKDVPNDDVKNYLLAKSDFGEGMQDDINLYVMQVRLNNASFRQKLDPMSKNISGRQNPLELVFKDISIFDAQNPIISLLIKELDVGKKDIASTLIKKASNPLDIEIQSRLKVLKDKNFKSNNGFPPPPPPPAAFFPPPPPPPPPPNNRPPSPPPPPNSFFSSSHIGIPCAPMAPTLSLIPTAASFSPIITTAAPLSPPRVFSFRPISSGENAANATGLGEAVAAKSEQERTREIDDIIGHVPSPPNLELSDEILNVLIDLQNVIKTDYVSNKTLNEEDIEDIKKEYDFEDIKNTVDEGVIPPILDFFNEEKNFFNTIVFLYTCKVKISFMTILTQIRAFMIFTSSKRRKQENNK